MFVYHSTWNSLDIVIVLTYSYTYIYIIHIYYIYIYCLSLEIGIPLGIPKPIPRLIGAGHVEVHRSRARRRLKLLQPVESWMAKNKKTCGSRGNTPQKQIDHYKLAILILKIMFHIIMITIGYKELMSLKMFASKASWDSTPNVAPLGHVPLRPQHLGKKEGTLDGELVQGSFQHFWISLGDLGVSQNLGFPTRINHCWEIWAGVFLLKKM